MNAGQQLAVWLETEHPDLFDQIFAVANRPRSLGALGDDSDIDISMPDLDLSDASSGVDISMPDLTGDLSTSIDSSSSGGGFLDSVGSVASSIGSSISSAASSVGNFLTSSAGLQTLAAVGTTYLAASAASSNAQAQQAVLQTQIARAQAGQSPAPITYAQTSTGQLVPVYQVSSPAATLYPSAVNAPIAALPSALQTAVNTGQSQLVTLPNGSTGYTLTPSVVSSLGGGSISLPLIALAAGLILILALEL